MSSAVSTRSGTPDKSHGFGYAYRVRQALPGAVAVIVLLVGAVGMVLPFLWMFATSMQSPTTAYQLPPSWIPFPLRTTNYEAALNNPVPLLRTMTNSAIVATAVALMNIITAPMAGFAFAKLRFRFRMPLFLLLMVSLMVPIQVTIIPLFVLLSQLGFIDTLISLILPVMTGAFGVFMMRQFFLSLPDEILEAAKIDGASIWTTYRSIALPLAKPSMAALGVITFLLSWNAYFMPLIFISSLDRSTMPLALVVMLGPYGTGDVAMIMAATTIAILPALFVFLVAQRWIVESLTRTGVKG
jgi:multiple sugar transport system permease protein